MASPVNTTLVGSIDWGDGQTSAGTITPKSGGNYDVAGGHVYDDRGVFRITVTVLEIPTGSGPTPAAAAPTWVRLVATIYSAAIVQSPASPKTR